ncbi:MAG: biotin transporter BioY [Clostridium sp.]|nr:biotin transporter BioY [Clostridium sp.]
MSTFTLPKIKTLDLTLIPMFTVLTAVGAFIKIPIGFVPVSLQTVMVVLSALLLGKKSVYAQLLYVFLGLVGFPIFTGGGGIGYIFYPTFGYLIGFIIAAFIMGALKERITKPKFLTLFLISLIGLVIIYSFGVSYLLFIRNFYLVGQAMAFTTALKFGALLFLPMDILWCGFGALVSLRLLRTPYFKQ